MRAGLGLGCHLRVRVNCHPTVQRLILALWHDMEAKVLGLQTALTESGGWLSAAGFQGTF
jgi:hypothetical protein